MLTVLADIGGDRAPGRAARPTASARPSGERLICKVLLRKFRHYGAACLASALADQPKGLPGRSLREPTSHQHAEQIWSSSRRCNRLSMGCMIRSVEQRKCRPFEMEQFSIYSPPWDLSSFHGPYSDVSKSRGTVSFEISIEKASALSGLWERARETCSASFESELS
jgi:hypothetical protein